MAQGLRTQVTLAEDWGSVPSTHMTANTFPYLQFQGFQALFWPPWVLYVHSVHTYMQSKHWYI